MTARSCEVLVTWREDEQVVMHVRIEQRRDGSSSAQYPCCMMSTHALARG
jgi:hypothetical protein